MPSSYTALCDGDALGEARVLAKRPVGSRSEGIRTVASRRISLYTLAHHIERMTS
jgi:hypothetical protein